MLKTSMMIVVFIVVFVSILSSCETTTHWFVTEEGRVHPQHDSAFDLRRPYDMVAMLRQEERAYSLDTLKQELLRRKFEIEAGENNDTGLEARFYNTDEDCVAAGKPLPDFDLYVSTILSLEELGLELNDFVNMREPPSPYPIHPSCVDLPLDFSIHSFEHLEGIALRNQVPSSPEPQILYQVVGRGQSLEDYGHRVYKALNKNQTSWVLYNMAAFFWRVKGNSEEAIECLRRALHFSPRRHKDVALLSLANVLHRARYSSEAAILLHAALDVAKSHPTHHYTLGNIYAVLGDYNKSSICYENAIALQSEPESAIAKWRAVLCHKKLERALESQHASLQKTLEDLKEYQKRHEQWQQQNERLVSEQAAIDGKIERRIAWEENKLKMDLANRVDDCVVVDSGDGKGTFVWCTFRHDNAVPDRTAMAHSWETLNSLHVPLLRVLNQTLAASSLSPSSSSNISNFFVDLSHFRDGDFANTQHPALYVERIRSVAPLLDDSDWPLETECDRALKTYPCHWAAYPTPFLSPADKGLDVSSIFSAESEPSNSLPYCDDDDDDYSYPSWMREDLKGIDVPLFKDKVIVPFLEEPGLLQVLVRLCDPPCAADSVQRMASPLHRSLSDASGSRRWIALMAASAYWRVTGSAFNAHVCVVKAARRTPARFRDVPLVALASLLHRRGHLESAQAVAEVALKYDESEALTHFLLGNLKSLNGNFTGAMSHYRRSLRLNPSSAQTFRFFRMLFCFLKYKENEAEVDENGPIGPCVSRTKPAPAPHYSEDFFDCKSVEFNDKIQRRCWLKSQSGISACSASDQSCGDVNHEKRKYVTEKSEKWYPRHYALDYLDQNPEKVHSRLRKDWFCMDSECNRLLLHPRKLPHGLTVRIGFERGNATPGEKTTSVHKAASGEKSAPAVYGTTGKENENRIDFRLVFFSDEEAESNLPGDTACFAFGDGSFSHGCTRAPLPLVRQLAAEGREELHLIQNAEISLKLDPQSATAKGPSSPSVAKVVPETATPELGRTAELELEPVVGHVHAVGEGAESTSTRLATRATTPLSEEVNIPSDPITLIPTEARGLAMKPPSSRRCPQILDSADKRGKDFFSSVWLSVQAKGVNTLKYINMEEQFPEAALTLKPYCTRLSSAMTLPRVKSRVDHLDSVKRRSSLTYEAEEALYNSLLLLGGTLPNMLPEEEIGARIALALERNSTSWVVFNLASLYWRVVGNVGEAVECLRRAVAHSVIGSGPGALDVSDVALISLGNVLHRAGRHDDAVTTLTHALVVNATTVMAHFATANALAARRQWTAAERFYLSTLFYQPQFRPAQVALVTVQCRKMEENRRRKRKGAGKKEEGEGGEEEYESNRGGKGKKRK